MLTLVVLGCIICTAIGQEAEPVERVTQQTERVIQQAESVPQQAESSIKKPKKPKITHITYGDVTIAPEDEGYVKIMLEKIAKFKRGEFCPYPDVDQCDNKEPSDIIKLIIDNVMQDLQETKRIKEERVKYLKASGNENKKLKIEINKDKQIE
ncbi:hypothetical protein O0L34_g7527 [Tuta absoluta]|nr:hypothetical protein O0L34_g7527 [Tuta absoluta]